MTTNLINSRSITDFQRNAKAVIDNLNETSEPVLLTINGKVQAVLVDPVTYQRMEAEIEAARFASALEMLTRSSGTGSRERPTLSPVEAPLVNLVEAAETGLATSESLPTSGLSNFML